MTEISVIIPVYNTEIYLRQCLDSVINQTFKDIEIICVDDGSTDGSINILKEYSNKYSNFTYLTQDHLCAGEARNKGLDIAKGKYIGFLDSDDYFEPDMLEKMHQRAMKFDADMVVCSSKLFSERTKTYKKNSIHYPINLNITPLDTPFSYKDFPDYIFNMFGFESCRNLLLKELITKNNIRFQNLKTCEDNIFSLITRICAKKIVVFNEELITNRIERENCIMNERGNYAINNIKAYIYIKNYLKQHKLYSKLKNSFFNYALGSCGFEISRCNDEQYKKFLRELKELMPFGWRRFKPALRKKYLTINHLYKLIGSKKIMLWGASLFLKEVLEKEQKENPNILGIIDKNPDNWGGMCGNYKIYPPEALNELKPDEVIMTILNNNENIYEELKKEFKEKYKGIKLHRNIFIDGNFIQCFFKSSIWLFIKDFEYNLCKYMPKAFYPYYLKNWYYKRTGQILNLKNPKTFNEKIQWLKLYDSTPIKTRLADKYLVRDWIKEKIGEEYLIPLLGVWEKADDINFDALPNQFVLKCNHGCGYNIIVKDKTKLDIQETKLQLTKWLNQNYALYGLELHYKNIKPLIIAEEYIDIKESNVELQCWCFNGSVEFISYETCKIDSNLRRGLYNKNWENLDFKISPQHYQDFEILPEKPSFLKELINISEILCKNFYFVRIDFAVINNRLKFREMTFTSGSGLSKFEPNEKALTIGQLIKLPKAN